MFPLFDGHCDTASAIFGKCPLRENTCQTDLVRGGIFSPRGQVYALWQHRLGPMLDNFLRECEKNADLIKVCGTYGEILSAFAAGKQAALISVEGAEQFSCSEAKLEGLYEKGVRIVHLCWNHDNALCGAAADSGAGLTEKGRAFVQKCAQLGVIIDLSHISDAAAWDILKMDCAKVFASHSNSRSICNVPRNLSDDLLRAIVENGGVVGLNLYPLFLRGADLALARRHAEHIMTLCGGKSLCLGCDFDGVDCLPDGIEGIEDMPALRAALGFSENELNDIFFNNLMNFWERAL